MAAIPHSRYAKEKMELRQTNRDIRIIFAEFPKKLVEILTFWARLVLRINWFLTFRDILLFKGLDGISEGAGYTLE